MSQNRRKKTQKNIPRNDQSSHVSGSLIPLGGQLTYALKTALSSDFGLAAQNTQTDTLNLVTWSPEINERLINQNSKCFLLVEKILKTLT